MAIRSFKDLEVWQIAMELAIITYEITNKLPTHEKYGLVSQMQRSAVSIPSNIAEGSKRTSRADFRQFCLIALGSAAELETQILIIQKLYPRVKLEKSLETNIRVQKMLTSLAKRLKEPELPKTKTDQP